MQIAADAKTGNLFDALQSDDGTETTTEAMKDMASEEKAPVTSTALVNHEL